MYSSHVRIKTKLLSWWMNLIHPNQIGIMAPFECKVYQVPPKRTWNNLGDTRSDSTYLQYARSDIKTNPSFKVWPEFKWTLSTLAPKNRKNRLNLRLVQLLFIEEMQLLVVAYHPKHLILMTFLSLTLGTLIVDDLHWESTHILDTFMAVRFLKVRQDFRQ